MTHKVNTGNGTYIVAHFDVLGFRDKFEKDPSGTESAMTELGSLINGVCSSSGIKRIFGTDNAILYAELGKGTDTRIVVDDLIKGLAGIQYHAFVDHKLLLRGGITIGEFTDDSFLIGDAYIRALDLEKVADWGCILVDREVKMLMSSKVREDWLFGCGDGRDMLNYIWIDRPHAERVERHLEVLSVYGHDKLEDFVEEISQEVLNGEASLETLKKSFHVMAGLKQVLNYHNQYCDRICGGYGHIEDVIPPIIDFDADTDRVTQTINSYNGKNRRSVHDAVDRLLDDYDRFWA